MKNLDRLSKKNVRSSDPQSPLSKVSLESLRQVAGGNRYSHSPYGSMCIIDEV